MCNDHTVSKRVINIDDVLLISKQQQSTMYPHLHIEATKTCPSRTIPEITQLITICDRVIDSQIMKGVCAHSFWSRIWDGAQRLSTMFQLPGL